MDSKVIDEPAFREKRFIFQDRSHAGKLLAEKLRNYAKMKNIRLLAIPAGGVPVGYEIAKELCFELNVIVVRKIQIPWNTEAGFGALTWSGEAVLNESLILRLGLNAELVQHSISKTKETIQERLKKFRGKKPLPNFKDKIIIIVDDGLASGFTMLAAVRSVKKQNPTKIIVAVPTASTGAIDLVAPEVNKLICLNVRSGPIFAVADAYQKWHDLPDEEVIEYLR